jgi:5-methylcytosine-specific restriction endonuclease McrA
VKMRVARRDENTCQICSKHLKDCDIEFDHIIPVAKGGSSEENNIQVTCFNCNRDKSDKIER